MNNQLPDGSFDWILSAEESLAPKAESSEDPKEDDESDDQYSEAFRNLCKSEIMPKILLQPRSEVLY